MVNPQEEVRICMWFALICIYFKNIFDQITFFSLNTTDLYMFREETKREDKGT